VEIEQHALRPAEVRVSRHGGYVIHSTSVAGHSLFGYIAGLGGLIAGNDGLRLVERKTKTFYRCRALNCSGTNQTTQAPHPPGAAAQLCAESAAQSVKVGKLLNKVAVYLWSTVNHVG
jgi:hypothetical protein